MEDLESKLQSVRKGMSKAVVEVTVGPPDHVQTLTKHRGTWLEGISETWSYGARGYGSAEMLGTVCFDETGKVRYVYGPDGAGDCYIE